MVDYIFSNKAYPIGVTDKAEVYLHMGEPK